MTFNHPYVVYRQAFSYTDIDLDQYVSGVRTSLPSTYSLISQLNGFEYRRCQAN